MANRANSTTAPANPPPGFPRRIPCRVGTEDEFLALQALRNRTTARLYELLDILMPRQAEPFVTSPENSGLTQASPTVLLFKEGRDV